MTANHQNSIMATQKCQPLSDPSKIYAYGNKTKIPKTAYNDEYEDREQDFASNSSQTQVKLNLVDPIHC